MKRILKLKISFTETDHNHLAQVLHYRHIWPNLGPRARIKLAWTHLSNTLWHFNQGVNWGAK